MRLHVEFAGTPGSGKSTLLHPLLNILRETDIPTYRLSTAHQIAILRNIGIPGERYFVKYVPNRILDIFLNTISRCSGSNQECYQLFHCDNPNLVQIIYSAITRKASTKKEKQTYLGWFSDLITGFQRSKTELYPSEALIIDEGFVNRSITLFCGVNKKYNNWNDAIVEYLSNTPQPDVLIIPKTPIELCKQRIQQGDRSLPYGAESNHEDSILNFLSEREECISITEEFYRDTSTDVLTIDNSGSLQQSKSILRAKIKTVI